MLENDYLIKKKMETTFKNLNTKGGRKRGKNTKKRWKHVKQVKRWCALTISIILLGFTGGSVVKNLPVNTRDTGYTGSIPESRRSSGEENGNPP